MYDVSQLNCQCTDDSLRVMSRYLIAIARLVNEGLVVSSAAKRAFRVQALLCARVE
jgi:hypothetical protein